MNIFYSIRKFKYSIYFLLLIATLVALHSCRKEEIIYYKNNEVQQDPFPNGPYATLSEYGFFVGDLSLQQPAPGVVPYKPASKLFTDYASKKRWIWMPEGVSASYNGDGNILDMPVGTVLIKNFYYERMLPNDEQIILETRIMIRQISGWIFGEYLWNAEQTEAYLDMDGSTLPISFIENGNTLNANYRFPSETQCLICHKSNEQPIPIGIKPQNINFDFDYGAGGTNQLQKLQDVGYLDQTVPGSINSVVNYSDPTQDLTMRLRSYLDINCAHCHSEGAHCDYRPMRLAFTETTDEVNMGVCVEPDEFINSALTYIISPGNISRSVMYYRLNSNNQNEQMPLLGRSIVHTEGLALLEEWINANTTICN